MPYITLNHIDGLVKSEREWPGRYNQNVVTSFIHCHWSLKTIVTKNSWRA